MKTLFFSLILILGFSFIPEARAQDHPHTDKQDDAKVIVLINRADWCGTCKANEARFKENVLPAFMGNPDYRIVMNDLTDDKTKGKSKKMLQKAGIEGIAAKKKKTGMVYFIDPGNKKGISEISIAESNDALKAAFTNALTEN